MLTFVKDERGHYAAQEGKHDDKVMSYGIALCAQGQQRSEIPVVKLNPKKFKWEDDLKADYYKADKETKERMILKYGQN